MLSLNFLRNHAAIVALIYAPLLFTECFEPIGIVGGNYATSAYAGLVGPDGTILSLSNSPDTLPNPGSIRSVDMNGSGNGIIAGTNGSAAYAALVSPSGAVSNLAPLPTGGIIYSVAINNSDSGIIGGTTGTAAYGALVSPSGAVLDLSTLPATGYLYSVGINGSGQGIIGGEDSGTGAPYAALVSPSGEVSSLGLTATGPTAGYVEAVAINDSGSAIIAGYNGTSPSPAYAALISPSGAVSTLPTGPSLLPGSGHLYSAAINNSGFAIIGGWDATNPAYAALISPSGAVSNLPVGTSALPTTGVIDSVAINDSGAALIGGYLGSPGSPAGSYAALVSASGAVTNLGPLPQSSSFSINSVDINQFGAGLIGGGNGTNSYAALVTPAGALVPLTLGNGVVDIHSVSLIRALSEIPTQCLGGNNLSLAKYINQEAPEKAFYFLPALLDGSLTSALESVAPTRNAAALYTASNNLFMLNQGLSRHLREQRHFLHYDWMRSSNAPTTYNWEEEEQLSVSLDWDHIHRYDQTREEIADAHFPSSDDPINDQSNLTFPPYAIWSEVIAGFSYQKAEHQTPGFDPVTGGLILGFEANIYADVHVGGGAAYTYTNINQHRGSGHAHIDQEYLFAYGFWGRHHFYLDAALWTGLFHIHQVRKIEMAGFNFRSTSDPRGWQLSPHLELGLDYNIWKRWFSLQPFAMLDWTNSWQRRYKEEGSGPFNMAQKQHYSSFLRSELGIRLFETIDFRAWRLVFEEKTSYVNKKPFGVGTVNAFLVGSPGSFTVETLSTPQNAGVIEFAMIFEPKDTGYPFGTIAYQGEFSEPYQSHQIFFEVCWNF